MTYLLSSFTTYLVVYKYLAIFIVASLSSFSFIIPIPLNEFMVIAGALSSLGHMNVILVLIISLFSMICADIIGYLLAYRYGDVILAILHIKKDENFFRVQKYLEKYAPWTIFICKIGGPFGPAVNIISGLIRIPKKQFFLFDFLGNSSDALFFVLSGYIVGVYWQVFLTDLWVFAIIALFLIALYLIFKTKFKLPKNI